MAASQLLSANKLLFLGGNFRGARHFWGDPYLNSTTVLFDNRRSNSCLCYPFCRLS